MNPLLQSYILPLQTIRIGTLLKCIQSTGLWLAATGQVIYLTHTFRAIKAHLTWAQVLTHATILFTTESAYTGLHLFDNLTPRALGTKEGNVSFNDALNTFYLRLYGVRHMVKDHSDCERGNPLPPHGLLFPINSKGSFICTIPQTG